jgi:hypothetical protein
VTLNTYTPMTRSFLPQSLSLIRENKVNFAYVGVASRHTFLLLLFMISVVVYLALITILN